MKKKAFFRQELIETFVIVFGIISLVILGVMLPIREADLSKNFRAKLAKRTILSAFGLTSAFTAANLIRRYITFERPLRDIEDALEEIQNGNFNVQVENRKEAHYGQLDSIISHINLMARELSGMETLRNDFIANISHELKAPLAVLMNLGTLLQKPGLSDEDRLKYAKTLTDETRKMGTMIGSILRLNRLENQQIYPNHEVYDVSEQVIECLLDFERVWEQKNIEIRNEIEEDVKINADPQLLGPIWENLFSNAVKYTGEGGIITVRLRETETEVEVTVADTGIGMSAETQAHMFDKFYQGDRSHGAEGNGLGLSLVHRILAIVGGEISVESAPDVGSVFVVTVPKRM